MNYELCNEIIPPLADFQPSFSGLSACVLSHSLSPLLRGVAQRAGVCYYGVQSNEITCACRTVIKPQQRHLLRVPISGQNTE